VLLATDNTECFHKHNLLKSLDINQSMAFNSKSLDDFGNSILTENKQREVS